MSTPDIDEARFYALRTFRRDGRAVMTPVWAAFRDGRGYVLTGERTWKVRRIRRDARVQLAPSDYRGVLRGDWRDGTARMLAGSEHARAVLVLRRKYGLQFRIFHAVSRIGGSRRRSGAAITIELTLDA